jgi:PEP-CTERM motif
MRKSVRVGGCILLVLLSLVAFVQDEAAAISIDVSTNNSGWVASYGSFSGPAFHLSCGAVDCISISSTGSDSGSFVGGGTAGAFSGTWSAALSFFLPVNAQSVTLAYNSIGVDDRATLSLNGTALGTFFIFGPQISGSTTTPFLLGAVNTLSLNVINNPFDTVSGPPVGFQFSGDGTAAVLNASVSYNVSAVPEPSSMLLLLSGMGLIGMLAWGRERNLIV